MYVKADHYVGTSTQSTQVNEQQAVRHEKILSSLEMEAFKVVFRLYRRWWGNASSLHSCEWQRANNQHFPSPSPPPPSAQVIANGAMYVAALGSFLVSVGFKVTRK